MLIVTNCDRRNRSDESALFQILKARLNRRTISDKRHPKRRFKTQMEYLFAFRVHPASFDVNRGMTDAQKAVVILCIERGQSSPMKVTQQRKKFFDSLVPNESLFSRVLSPLASQQKEWFPPPSLFKRVGHIIFVCLFNIIFFQILKLSFFEQVFRP